MDRAVLALLENKKFTVRPRCVHGDATCSDFVCEHHMSTLVTSRAISSNTGPRESLQRRFTFKKQALPDGSSIVKDVKCEGVHRSYLDYRRLVCGWMVCLLSGVKCSDELLANDLLRSRVES